MTTLNDFVNRFIIFLINELLPIKNELTNEEAIHLLHELLTLKEAQGHQELVNKYKNINYYIIKLKENKKDV